VSKLGTVETRDSLREARMRPGFAITVGEGNSTEAREESVFLEN
jgi:hypothetical protein